MSTVTLNHIPLRVPSVLPGRWVYLRAWTTYPSGAMERSHGCCMFELMATATEAFVAIPGLEPKRFPSLGCAQANAEAIDAYLVSIGAEPVLAGEWPPGCVGLSTREADRTPFRDDDYNEAHAAMQAKGYSGLFAKP